MNDVQKEIQARKIQLVSGQRTTVTEYRTSPNKSWTAIFFSNSTGANSIRLFQKQLGGGFGTEGEVEYSLGNFPNGDTITGSGACVISALAETTCELSYYFVDEVYSQQLPPLCNTYTIDTQPLYATIGYPPFGRYLCSILSSTNFDIRLVTAAGDLVLNRAVTASFFFTNRSYFLHAPNLQLQLRNTIASQIIHVAHYQN